MREFADALPCEQDLRCTDDGGGRTEPGTIPLGRVDGMCGSDPMRRQEGQEALRQLFASDEVHAVADRVCGHTWWRVRGNQQRSDRPPTAASMKIPQVQCVVERLPHAGTCEVGGPDLELNHSDTPIAEDHGIDPPLAAWNLVLEQDGPGSS